MKTTLIAVGDVNLMGVTDPATPFRKVMPEFQSADLVFCNLECLLAGGSGGTWETEGFFADPHVATECLASAGIAAVGMANNVTYGAEPIMASLARLDRQGIPHTGAGADRKAAAQPAIVERKGVRFGFLQRSSVYWATNHEATDTAPGIAALRGHTAYQVPMYKVKREIPPLNRPGIPPYIVTWADRDYLAAFERDVAALRERADVVVASFHWGFKKDVLAYMSEIAHAAIDAGADAVVGHGPHYSLGIEVYRGKPIFYGLGSFSFQTGHGGFVHDAWVGMMAKFGFDGTRLDRASFEFVRRNAENETYVCELDAEQAELGDIVGRSRAMGAELVRDGNEMVVTLP
ncbi:CapA family protein [Jiella sonneratiae]|uniref:CapA family protein n=1 Tax=Jiella sonneratiae TaxID=2816856 RepID=A0ABS3JAC7_9HYPH|nr:CapA family protein [Jiella sonneratiae]MBO0906085.1 CapA family protein [Jiella sonneratiae]